MSTFTMQTKDAVEYLGGVVTFENGLLKVEGNVGLSNYEIFDEAHREQLNSKILRTYWMWEIGVETAELWRFNMETSMALIMPYYNQLYASEKLSFDPLKTIDVQTVSESESNHIGSSESETSQDQTNANESRAVNSSFPQSQLARNRDYATSAVDSTSSGSGTANTEGTEQNQSNDKGESESRTSGYQGIPSDLLLAFRQTILNLDQDIVNSLQDNFMGIWHDGSRYFDSYSIGRYTI